MLNSVSSQPVKISNKNKQNIPINHTNITFGNLQDSKIETTSMSTSQKAAIVMGIITLGSLVYASLHGKNILKKAGKGTNLWENIKTGYKNFFKATEKTDVEKSLGPSEKISESGMSNSQATVKQDIGKSSGKPEKTPELAISSHQAVNLGAKEMLMEACGEKYPDKIESLLQQEKYKPILDTLLMYKTNGQVPQEHIKEILSTLAEVSDKTSIDCSLKAISKIIESPENIKYCYEADIMTHADPYSLFSKDFFHEDMPSFLLKHFDQLKKYNFKVSDISDLMYIPEDKLNSLLDKVCSIRRFSGYELQELSRLPIEKHSRIIELAKMTEYKTVDVSESYFGHASPRSNYVDQECWKYSADGIIKRINANY